MPQFGAESVRQRSTLHPDLQAVLNEAILYIDFRITEGHRGKEKQDAAVADGASKVSWPKSRHNASPSTAVDVMPHPVPQDWKTSEWFARRQYFLAGYIKAVADQTGIALRQGVDWNQSGKFSSKNSWDAPHSELDAWR